MPQAHDEDNTVSITFVVDPGNRAYVNRVNFRGNTKTEDEVLRREMRQMEGGWASTYLIDQSTRASISPFWPMPSIASSLKIPVPARCC
ncbi:Outer membrane protein assembly factor BamA [Stutzerimonas stutzeri]